MCALCQSGDMCSEINSTHWKTKQREILTEKMHKFSSAETTRMGWAVRARYMRWKQDKEHWKTIYWIARWYFDSLKTALWNVFEGNKFVVEIWWKVFSVWFWCFSQTINRFHQKQQYVHFRRSCETRKWISCLKDGKSSRNAKRIGNQMIFKFKSRKKKSPEKTQRILPMWTERWRIAGKLL